MVLSSFEQGFCITVMTELQMENVSYNVHGERFNVPVKLRYAFAVVNDAEWLVIQWQKEIIACLPLLHYSFATVKKPAPALSLQKRYDHQAALL